VLFSAKGPVVSSANLELADNSPGHFPGALVHWAGRLRPAEHDRHTFEMAFKAIDDALLKTASYLAVGEVSANKETEQTLSGLWMNASRAVSPIDPGFADAMAYKGLGWANPRFWSVAKSDGYKIKLTDVQKARTLMTRERHRIEQSSFRLPQSQVHISAGSPVLIVTLIFAGIFGLACIYGGIQLMGASGAGETTFNFFGLQFSTKQAGVAAIALGAATIILTFRKVLKTVVDLGRI
jgi:hypothetical protein